MGHYHALIREPAGKFGAEKEVWRDANDVNVSIMSEERIDKLFPPRPTTLCEDHTRGTRACSSSDAYFLMYRKRCSAPMEVADSAIPGEHRNEIQVENSKTCFLAEPVRDSKKAPRSPDLCTVGGP